MSAAGSRESQGCRTSMRIPHPQIVLVLLLLWSVPPSWEKKGSCRNFRRRHMLKMACSDGGKILLPKLMGFSGKDCTGCLGQSPALMVQGNDCSWNSRCKVDLSARRMVTGCYTNMKSVQVAEGQCIHNGTRIYDLITKKTQFSSSVGHQLPRDAFLVRSHRKFPWNYSYKKLGSESHQLRFIVQMGDINRRLLVSVLSMDIDSRRDTLYILHKQSLNLVKAGHNIQINIEDLSYIVLGFNSSLNHHYPNIAKTRGFVMCLKLVDKDEQQKTKSVCDDVMNHEKLKFSLVKRKPQKCPGKGRRRRQKCNARKLKKG